MSDPLLSVVHEDDDLLVVDKPAGLVVHPTRDGERSSLIGRVRLYLGHGEGRLVNRLDRETSGLVVVGKHVDVARVLGRALTAGTVEKHYLAIVHGALEAPLTIDAPLGRDETSVVAIKDTVRPDGAAAVTDVRPRRTFTRDGATYTRVDVAPRSGRKHQIRIHLAHAGHPVVGDKIYGGDETTYLRFVTGTMTDADRARLVLPNHALHAAALAFEWNGRMWTFEASPPDRFLALADVI